MAATTASKVAALAPGEVVLDHGIGAARVYRVGGSTGTVYTTTYATCDCQAGLNGRDCKHCRKIRALHAAEAAVTPAPAPTADPFAILPAVADDDLDADFAPAADHAVTVATAAATLTVRPATVRRYVKAGKLATLGDGISAASVDAYAATRAANVARTRFRKAVRTTPVTVADRIEAAEAKRKRAAELEAQVEQLRAEAKATLAEFGIGEHDGWVITSSSRQIRDTKAIAADYKARGAEIPMTASAPSYRAQKLA